MTFFVLDLKIPAIENLGVTKVKEQEQEKTSVDIIIIIGFKRHN